MDKPHARIFAELLEGGKTYTTKRGSILDTEFWKKYVFGNPKVRQHNAKFNRFKNRMLKKNIPYAKWGEQKTFANENKVKLSYRYLNNKLFCAILNNVASVAAKEQLVKDTGIPTFCEPVYWKKINYGQIKDGDTWKYCVKFERTFKQPKNKIFYKPLLKHQDLDRLLNQYKLNQYVKGSDINEKCSQLVSYVKKHHPHLYKSPKETKKGSYAVRNPKFISRRKRRSVPTGGIASLLKRLSKRLSAHKKSLKRKSLRK